MEKISHVLIVEDDPFIREVLTFTLKKDFKVVTRTNGMEAMEWLEQGNPVDLVIADLQMPLLNGLELIRIVRASSQLSHLPILIISASDDSNVRINCLQAGADAYMTKPFNPLEAKAQVEALLRRRGLSVESSPYFSSNNKVS